MGDRKPGSAEERRYADASRAVRQFLALPRGDDPQVHAIGPLRHAAKYHRAFGRVEEWIDVTGFLVIMDDQHVAHALRRHGSLRSEAKRGQIGLERDDFARLPQILGDPDTDESGDKGRRGGPAAVVTKVIGGVRYRVIVEVRARQRQIAFVSMFKVRV